MMGFNPETGRQTFQLEASRNMKMYILSPQRLSKQGSLEIAEELYVCVCVCTVGM